MRPKSLCFVTAGLILCALAEAARADAISPPEPIQCERGQEAVTDHGGTHCEFVSCKTDVDCPSGMRCVERQETDCDPRGEPCWTNQVRRCSPGGAPAEHPGATPGGAKRSGCGCRAGGSDVSPAALGLALAALLLAARRRGGHPASRA